MILPTSAALDAHIEMMATYYDMRKVSAGTMRHDLAVLRRLQHEATREAMRPRSSGEVPVLDLVKFREDRGMVHHDGGDAA